MNRTFHIGNKDRPVNFGRNALMEFERITGRSLMGRIENGVYQAPDLTDIFANIDRCVRVAYCGLKWGLYNKDIGSEPVPDFTLQQVADWTQEEEPVFTKILEYLLECMAPKTTNTPLSPGEGGGGKV